MEPCASAPRDAPHAHAPDVAAPTDITATISDLISFDDPACAGTTSPPSACAAPAWTATDYALALGDPTPHWWRYLRQYLLVHKYHANTESRPIVRSVFAPVFADALIPNHIIYISGASRGGICAGISGSANTCHDRQYLRQLPLSVADAATPWRQRPSARCAPSAATQPPAARARSPRCFAPHAKLLLAACRL